MSVAGRLGRLRLLHEFAFDRDLDLLANDHPAVQDGAETKAEVLPVDLDRLTSEGPTQIDTSTPSEQLIIPLTIKSTRDSSKRNANNLHSDLDTMIKNKGFTEISVRSHTSLLDVTYGYKLKSEFIVVSLFCNIHSTVYQI